MCDTMVSLTDDGVLFGKNSDRDPNEAQILEWYAGGTHASGEQVNATWITIDQVPVTHAIAISRPWWMWGAEMGANEHGLTIGNEAVFTRESTKGDPGLLGMDLLRLALERAATVDEAVQIIVTLLEKHGQVGSCSHDNPSFTYHNSFLIADPNGAAVLETAGKYWAVEDVTGRGRSISNGLTIPGFAEEYSDPLRSTVGRCATRRAVTEEAAARALDPYHLMVALGDNGTDAGPEWSPISGSLGGPNVHAGGLVTSSQTVSSWVADLRSDPLHWVTATADAGLSLFKPVRIDQPTDLGPKPTNVLDPDTVWWHHELFHRLALRDWLHSAAIIGQQQAQIQQRWLAAPPSTAEAFAEARLVENDWRLQLLELSLFDTRPRWNQRQWQKYNLAALGALGG